MSETRGVASPGNLCKDAVVHSRGPSHGIPSEPVISGGAGSVGAEPGRADGASVLEVESNEAGAGAAAKRCFQDNFRKQKVADSDEAAANAVAAVATSEMQPVGEASVELQWAVRGGGGRGRGYQRKHRGLDPVIPVTEPSLLGAVEDFYGLRAEFPLRTHLITRCIEAQERPRRIYFISDAARRVLMLDESESLKVTATGLKVR
jgi:hypothetical protein